jgi:amidohydrolase
MGESTPTLTGDDGSERLTSSNDGLIELVSANAEARRDRMIKLRRRLHATPESAHKEYETTRLVAETLTERGMEPRVMSDGVGVIADLDLGAASGSMIALRSELDCVGVNDDKQVPYASTHPGLCHACGHDAHTTILLAAASLVAEQAGQIRAGRKFAHNLRFIFQPAEETATGARAMIKQGALNGVEAIMAVHVDPFLEVGQIGFRKGALTSACKAFEVMIRGRSGHTARPFEAIDPIPAATTVIDLFYQLGPRSIDTRYPLSLTVASVQSGVSVNAIPDHAVIQGTMRASRLVDLEAVQRRMQAVVNGAADATGCDITLEFHHSCPATDNDSDVIDAMAGATQAIIGPEAVQWLDVPSLGGEDFAFYQELIPGAMVRLGAALPDVRARRPLHSSLFDVDEGCLLIGAKALTWSALRLAMSVGMEHM